MVAVPGVPAIQEIEVVGALEPGSSTAVSCNGTTALILGDRVRHCFKKKKSHKEEVNLVFNIQQKYTSKLKQNKGISDRQIWENLPSIDKSHKKFLKKIFWPKRTYCRVEIQFCRKEWRTSGTSMLINLSAQIRG